MLSGAALVLAMGGCGSPVGGADPQTTLTVQQPLDTKYLPSDEPYHLGAEEFNRGHYGLAEGYFRQAVEKAKENGSAWIGLAASYDRLRRFDLADRAYVHAIEICGETVQILNNQGYSLMLRGNLAGARQKFLKALDQDPGNPVIINNIRLLDGSGSLIAPVTAGPLVSEPH